MRQVGLADRCRARPVSGSCRERASSGFASAFRHGTGESIDDLDGGVEQQTGYRSEFQGPPPTVRTFDNAVEEAAFAVETIQGWLADGVAPSAIGVVGRTHGDTTAVEHALSAAEVPWSELGKGGKGVGVGSMHASKGLEFARLVVVGVSADRVPLPLAVTNEADDASQHALDLQRERCLLYVACTRGRDALVVTGAGGVSQFLPS